MTLTSQFFRLFVSSTFGDMQMERDALQKSVFPQLRQLCRERGARFQAIDLRWGVSQEASNDQRTIAICLEEIRRCRRLSPNIYFLVLLGNRYGTRLLPDSIDADEFQQLARFTNETNFSLLTPWYRLDENALPATYLLQPHTGEYATPEKWIPLEQELRKILAAASEHAALPEAAKQKYLASVTELEIDEGVFRMDATDKQALCFFRSISGDPTGPNAALYIDDDPDDQTRLQKLKQRLTQQLPHGIFHFTARWQDQDLTTDHLERFCSNVYKQLALRIVAALQLSRSLDIVAKEISLHQQFAKARTQFFIGRHEAIDVVRKYLEGSHHRPLVISGTSGSGKSTLIAKSAQLATLTYANAVVEDIYLGTTPQTSNLRDMLNYLCRKILIDYGTHSKDVPFDEASLSSYFNECLELATPSKPLYLFIDALDQLAERGRKYFWVPRSLPTSVRLIVSIQPGQESSQLADAIGETDIVTLHPMSPQEGSELLETWLIKEAQRTLQPEQREAVLKAFSIHGLPLYLRLAYEQARQWHSYDSKVDLDPDLVGLTQDLFHTLSKPVNHGQVLVSNALGYLAASRNGLSEDEFVDVLSTKEILDDVIIRSPSSPVVNHLPTVIWSRLYFDLEPYMAERNEDDTIVLTFYHQVVNKVATSIYLKGATGVLRHQQLAHYWKSQELIVSTQSNVVLNQRKLNQLPYQQTAGQLWDNLYDTLTDFEFMEAKAVSGGNVVEAITSSPTQLSSSARWRAYLNNWSRIHSIASGVAALLEDFSRAISHWPDLLHDQEHMVRKATLTAYSRALRLEEHIISQYPDSLWQQIYNHLKWMKGIRRTELDAEYDLRSRPRATSWLQLDTQPSESPALLFTLARHQGAINDCTISSNGSMAISVSRDWHLIAWDFLTGRELFAIEVDQWEILCCAISPDGAWVVTGSRNSFNFDDAGDRDDLTTLEQREILRIIDLNARDKRMTLAGHKAEFNAAICDCAVSPDGSLVLSASADGTLKRWDVLSGVEMLTFRGHQKGVWGCAISPNGSWIVSASADMTLKIWDSGTGEVIKTLIGHTNEVIDCAISPDGSWICSASYDGTVRIWGVATGTEKAVLHGHTDGVINCSISPDGILIASASADKTVRIWEVATGELRATLHGHSDLVSSCAFTPDGAQLISSSYDKTLKVWDVYTALSTPIIKNTFIDVTAVAVSPEGDWGLCASQVDPYVSVFDAHTGELSQILTAHNHPVTDCAMSANGSTLVTVDYAGTVVVWDASTHQTRLTISGDSAEAQSFHLKLYNQTGSATKFLRELLSEIALIGIKIFHTPLFLNLFVSTKKTIVEAESLTPDKELRNSKLKFISCAINRDGTRIVAATKESWVLVWDGQTGEGIAAIFHPLVRTCALNPEGNIVISAGGNPLGAVDGLHTVWASKIEGKGWIRSFKNDALLINHLTINQKGDQIASAASDGTITLWNLRSQAKQITFRGHAHGTFDGAFGVLIGGVQASSFSYDGLHLASVSNDGVLKVWDLALRKCIVTLFINDQLTTCAWHPDGMHIWCGGAKGIYLLQVMGSMH